MDAIGTMEDLGELADNLGINWSADLDDEGVPFFDVVCEYSDEEGHDSSRFTQSRFDAYLRGRVDERDAWKRVAEHYVHNNGPERPLR